MHNTSRVFPNLLYASGRHGILWRLRACCLLFPLIALVSARAQEKPAAYEYSVTGQVVEADGWLTAQTAATVNMKLPAGQDIIRIRGKSGAEKAGVVIALKDNKGVVTNLSLKAEDLRIYSGAHSDKPFPDTYLRLTWPGKWPDNQGSFFVRPNMDIYSDARRKEIFPAWSTLPPASEHVWTLVLQRKAAATQLWLNGQFMNELQLEYPLATCEFKLAPGAALREVKAEEAAEGADGVLSLPISNYARQGVMANAQIKLLANVALPKGIQVDAQPGSSHITVDGLGRIPARSDDLVSFSWRRSAVDALSEARIFAVPAETYSYVQLLCAASDDPAKTPSFTVRLTRYGRSRGDAIADTTVALPTGVASNSASTRRVGEVTYGEGAARKTVPLWIVRVPLKTGQIQDLLRDDTTKSGSFGTHRYLDFEILDPTVKAEEDDIFPPRLLPKERTFWPGSLRSSVHIFAAALERSPASLDARTNQPLQVLYASDNPEWHATVQAREPGSYTVEWEFVDVDGKPVTVGKKTVTLTAATPTEVIKIPITTGNGWFATRTRLTDSKGEELVDHRSAFVFLPPDTRKAGFESPYGTWWFHWAHGGEPNIDLVGPLLQRAGLRHTILPNSLPEEITKKYGVTAWSIPWKVTLKPEMSEMMAAHEEHIRKYLELWPSVNKMKVWHESGSNGAPFPSELWGEAPPAMDEKSQANWKFRMEYVTALAKMVREKFPNLKIQYGNDGNSLGIIAGLLRHGFPREYIDTIATEDLGQTIVPERAISDSLQSAWFLRQTARKLGYDDVPVTASYEWMNRRTHAVGARNQAEWQIRDALHALAYGFDTISLGTIHDAGTGYYYSLWGGGGLTRRYPVMEPKPIYAAIATHTRVLDGAKFQRKVPAGLLSLYALEFRRGTEWVYAIWTAHGQRAVNLRFQDGGRSTLIDLYGREKSVQAANLEIAASTAPQYLVSASQLTEIIPGKATYPGDEPPAQPFVVDAMDKAANWTVAFDEPKWMNRSGGNIPHGTPGNFQLREVNDPEMGACLELELDPKQLRWEVEHEFVTLKLNLPVVSPGPFQNAGLWVKGNGGWGEIKLQAQSDKGALVTPGFVSYGSWSGQSSINFDGWHFMKYPVGQDPRWSPNGTVTSLIITMPQKTLHLTEMEDVPDLKIRLKALSLY